MENIFVEFLPPWVETGLQPAFYDKESGTVLQQTARMYARVNMLIRMFNKLGKKVEELQAWFANIDLHEEIDKILKEYIDEGTFYETLDYNPVTQSLTLTFDIARA